MTSPNVLPSKSKPGTRSNCKAFPIIHLAIALFAAFLFTTPAPAQSRDSILPGPKPADLPNAWKPWIGDYGLVQKHSIGTVYVLGEKDGMIWILQRQGNADQISYIPLERFAADQTPPTDRNHGIRLHWDSSGEHPILIVGDVGNTKLTPDFNASQQASITPVRPIAELRKQAFAATPPSEEGPFRKSDLVELAALDPAIHLDIRYATSNDFLGVPVYTQARAFLQRPAAESLVRVLHKLQPLGYGLLIHDGYRPWYVTKIFWDAAPPEGKIFVADPAQGSRHNRGCAVDLTLYDLRTRQPVEIIGGYDEMSPRSFPNYPGGTSLQRWHRDLLRRAMESEGFTVYESEWWHFDYKDWREYGVLNVPFEKLVIGANPNEN